MPRLVASALYIPRFAEAARERGLELVPMEPVRAHAAAVLEWRPAHGAPARRIAAARASGWLGPLLLVMAEGGAAGIADALDSGADDAVHAPACPSELAARLAARLRGHSPCIRIGALEIDPVVRTVSREGRPIALLPREYRLLLYLARTPGRTVGRTELLKAVWQLDFDPGTNVVQVHVSRLRAHLDRGFATPLILTDKGRGYRLIA